MKTSKLRKIIRKTIKEGFRDPEDNYGFGDLKYSTDDYEVGDTVELSEPFPENPGLGKVTNVDIERDIVTVEFSYKPGQVIFPGSPGGFKENFDDKLRGALGDDDFERATSKHVPGLGDVANIDDKTDISTGKKTFMQMMMAFTDEPFLIETGLKLYDAWARGEGGLKPSRILDILKDTSNK